MNLGGPGSNGLRLVAAVGLLIVPALSGCIGPGDSASCTVTVPRLSGGASATYDASGFTFLPWTIGAALVEWATVGPDDDPNDSELIVLPEDSEIHLDLRSRARPVVDLYGRQRSAVQATYRAEVPDRPNAIPFGDVWVDPETGGLVKQNSRNEYLREGDAFHFHGTGVVNHTGPLFAPLFSGRSLSEGDAGQVDYPEGLAVAKLPPNATLTWRVTDVHNTADGCRAKVHIDTGTDDEDNVFRLTFTSDVPLPVRLQAVDTDPEKREASPRETPLEMDLASWQAGDGVEIAPFRGHSWYEQSTLTRRAPEDTFLPGRGGVFPTDFDEAVAAAREGSTGAWLDANPEARVAFARHWMGHPDSEVNDKWLIQWIDSNGSDRSVEVTNRSESPLGVQDSLESSVIQFRRDSSYPDLPDRWLTLRSMADLHDQRYSRDPTFLQCAFDDGTCFVGTHRSTHTRYACDMFCGEDNYGGSPLGIGMVFWLERGWYLKDQSFDPAGLARPAG